jgi:lysophospholipase L1-like esterase
VAPDVIVIYEGVNDLSRDTRELAERQGIFRGNVDDDNLLGRWSLAWSLVEKNLRLMYRQRQAAAAALQRLRFEPAELSRGFRDRLDGLVREATETAPIVALATFSQKVRPEQTAAERLRAANTHLYYMPHMTPADILSAFDEYNRVIREIAEKHGLILIGGEETIPADDEHFADSVHFTDEGSRAMAARVASGLIESSQLQAFVLARTELNRHKEDRARLQY